MTSQKEFKINLCIDCKWHELWLPKINLGGEFPDIESKREKCNHKNNFSFVDGHLNYRDPETLRHKGPCGICGSWWEPKEDMGEVI